MGGRGGAGEKMVSLGNGGLQIDKKTYNMAKEAYRLEGLATGLVSNESSIKYGVAHQIAVGGVNSVKGEMQRRIQVYQEKINRKTNASADKPLTVNGYGERTHREITSSTYERAQKSLNKKVNDWFGKR